MEGFGAASFYCYAAPVPVGLGEKWIQPGVWSVDMGEFLLPYEAVRGAADPAGAVLGFLESTYAAATDCARWNRAALDRK